MSTPKSRVPRLLLVVMIALALVAAACGGGDDTGGDEPVAPEPAADEPAADEPSADEPEVDEPAAEEPSGPVQTVKIGVAFADLAAFATLNEAFGIGDPEEQARAVLDGWIRDGLVPDGLEIELAFAPYNIISDAEKLGSCTKLAQDENVFAAIGGLAFTVGADCLADRFEIPIIDTEAAPPSAYQRGAPNFFTLRADQATQLRTFAQWAIDGGYLDGKTIGLYFENRLDEGVAPMKDDLAAAGFEIASEVSTSGEGIGSPEDQISVRRFIEDEIDLVLPLVGGSSAVNVYSFAEEQGFRPTYLDLDYGEHTTDVAAATNPEVQYDGTLAMTMTRAGEIAAGVDNPAMEACLSNYERYSGLDIARTSPESGEFNSIVRTCDLMGIVLAGLTAAASDLNAANFIAGIENAGTFTFASHGNGSFTADDHSGVDEAREIQWDAGCPCWVAVSDLFTMTPG